MHGPPGFAERYAFSVIVEIGDSWWVSVLSFYCSVLQWKQEREGSAIVFLSSERWETRESFQKNPTVYRAPVDLLASVAKGRLGTLIETQLCDKMIAPVFIVFYQSSHVLQLFLKL